MRIGSAPTFTAIILMALILKTKGIRSKDGKTMYKASDVSTINSEDTVSIIRELADGIVLNAGFSPGKRFGTSRYCRPYRPPSPTKVLDKLEMAKLKGNASESFIPGHAVVLVGARRKNGKLSYHYMNSWKDFCIRRDKRGRWIPDDGFGKIDADRLMRSVVRICRFKEDPTDRSFLPEQLPLNTDTAVTDRNYKLLFN